MSHPDELGGPRRCVFYVAILRPGVEPFWVSLDSGEHTWDSARARAVELAAAYPPGWSDPDSIGHLVVAQQVPATVMDKSAVVIGRAGVRYRRRRGQTVSLPVWAWGKGTKVPEIPTARAQILRNLPATARRHTAKGAFPWLVFSSFHACVQGRKEHEVERAMVLLTADRLLERHPTQRRWRITGAMLLLSSQTRSQETA